MDNIKVIVTEDGSHTLLHEALQETYHSVHGAIRESQHVFIRHGLEYWLQESGKRKLRILEIGFGTGLNAVLTLLKVLEMKLEVYYESWETNPLSDEVVDQLNYHETLGSVQLFRELHRADWNKDVRIAEGFTFRKTNDSILSGTLTASSSFDLIFYDAFAPSRQPEMWTFDVLKKVTDHLSHHGVWVTYCAKGQVKRDLKALNLRVETLQGPPGKKEMIRATHE